MTEIHAEHVGSLLRPQRLLDAREAHARGEIGEAELAAIEDEAIVHVVQLQREAGVPVVTDGEFRRTSWLGPLYESAANLEDSRGEEGRRIVAWSGPGAAEANAEMPIPAQVARERLRLKGRLSGRESPFLAAHAGGPFKVTLPGPTMYVNLFHKGVSETGYAAREALLDHLVQLWKDEVDALAADGATGIQLDSLRFTHVIGQRRNMLGDLTDEEAIEEAVVSDNAVLAHARSRGLTAGVHMCRGNHRSAWAAAGGYDPVAERFFTRTEADRLLLEYDDDRSGGFEPLRFVPKGKTVVLGLVTTKTPELEDKDELRRRVDEAARYHDLEDLALSPQCGFASTYLGNLLTEDDEKRKLELVVETARSIWG